MIDLYPQIHPIAFTKFKDEIEIAGGRFAESEAYINDPQYDIGILLGPTLGIYYLWYNDELYEVYKKYEVYKNSPWGISSTRWWLRRIEEQRKDIIKIIEEYFEKLK